MRKHAIQGVQRRGGDIHDTTEVLSEYEMQFGAFRGQTFKWVIENALGYAGYLVDDMRNETTTSTPLSQNKAFFKAYVQLFPECRLVIGKKREQRLKKVQQLQTSARAMPTTISTTDVTAIGRVYSSVTAAVAPLLNRNTSPHRISAAISKTLANRRGNSAPNIPPPRMPAASTEVLIVNNQAPATLSKSPSQSPEFSDEEICSIAERIEQEIGMYRVK